MILGKIGRFLRRWRLKRGGAIIADDLQSFETFFSGYPQGFKCGTQVMFSAGARALVGATAGVPGRLTLGNRVFLNHSAIIDCHKEIVIGDRVLIGPNAYVCDFDHKIELTNDHAVENEGKAESVYIGDDVWIGANSVILKGVAIGAGAVVGAGSVVTRNVAPLAVVVGNPARLLKMRDNNAN